MLVRSSNIFKYHTEDNVNKYKMQILNCDFIHQEKITEIIFH